MGTPGPEYLSDESRAFWDEIVAGWAPTADGLKQLEAACSAWDRMQEARAIIDRDGLIVDTKHGLRAHPAIAIERDSRLAALRAIRELNLESSDGQAPEARLPRGRGRVQ